MYHLKIQLTVFLAKGHTAHPLCSPHRLTSLCTDQKNPSAFVSEVNYLKKKKLYFFSPHSKILLCEATKGKEIKGVTLESA